VAFAAWDEKSIMPLFDKKVMKAMLGGVGSSGALSILEWADNIVRITGRTARDEMTYPEALRFMRNNTQQTFLGYAKREQVLRASKFYKTNLANGYKRDEVYEDSLANAISILLGIPKVGEDSYADMDKLLVESTKLPEFGTPDYKKEMQEMAVATVDRYVKETILLQSFGPEITTYHDELVTRIEKGMNLELATLPYQDAMEYRNAVQAELAKRLGRDDKDRETILALTGKIPTIAHNAKGLKEVLSIGVSQAANDSPQLKAAVNEWLASDDILLNGYEDREE
jgi:hypothetical protein